MYIAISVIIMALTTYLIRVLPMTLFRKPIQSRYLKSFLHYVPYAVLGGMTFPYIFYSVPNGNAALVGTLVALLLGYLEKSLTVVAICSVLAVYLMSGL